MLSSKGQVDNERSMFQYAKRHGIVMQKGAWFEFSDGKKTYKAQGEDKALALFVAPGIFSHMKELLKEKMDSKAIAPPVG